jgi:hypothetical protein
MKCEELKTIDFSNCFNLTFFGVVLKFDTIYQYITRNIKVVNLNNCRNLQVQSLQWIRQHYLT